MYARALHIGLVFIARPEERKVSRARRNAGDPLICVCAQSPCLECGCLCVWCTRRVRARNGGERGSLSHTHTPTSKAEHEGAAHVYTHLRAAVKGNICVGAHGDY